MCCYGRVTRRELTVAQKCDGLDLHRGGVVKLFDTGDRSRRSVLPQPGGI
ncbi:MAG: hypothetical protein QOI14_893, partial [Actinomycetota bacterium]|nr:hypothetical protein [Actinomycetota bacterium]